jgi:hypothetical protein
MCSYLTACTSVPAAAHLQNPYSTRPKYPTRVAFPISKREIRHAVHNHFSDTPSMCHYRVATFAPAVMFQVSRKYMDLCKIW